MRRLLALLALIALPAAAITFDPPAPDSHSWVRATVLVRACAPARPVVTRDGSKITILVRAAPGIACIPEILSPSVTADLGVLPGGVYDVEVTGATAAEHATLEVRGVDPFRVAPPGASMFGGWQVSIRDINPNGGAETPVIRFGDGVATLVQNQITSYLVRVPPHAPGIVDVTLTYSDGTTETAKAAFKYIPENAGADPFIYERVLFPIAFEGPGAFGSRWTTDNTWEVVGGVAAVGPTRLDKTTAAAGIEIFPGRDIGDVLAASSRIRDLTRQAESAGTSVPVVFERDFVDAPLLFPDVPLTANARAMLRVWSLAPATVFVARRGVGVRIATVDPGGQNLSFAARDITSIVGSGGGEIVLSTSPGAPKLWAMISVTNNDTQAVTVVTPSQKATPLEVR